MEKKLEILKLSIPAISELSARKLLGGDGYGLEEETTYTGWELPEVEVGYDRPERWTGDPEEMMMPDDAMDYEDWYQEDFENRDENNDRDDKRNDEALDGNDNTAQYDLATEIAKMNAILKELPENLKKLITNNNIKIVIDPELKDFEGNSKAGQYVNGVITLRYANESNLMGELVHVYQEQLGIKNTANHAMNEFQEKLMRDVLAIDDYLLNGKGFPYNVEGVVSDSYTYENDQKDWLTFLLSITDDNGVISLKEWESGVNEYFDVFQKGYKNIENYQGGFDANYQYNWENFFKTFGVKYK